MGCTNSSETGPHSPTPNEIENATPDAHSTHVAPVNTVCESAQTEENIKSSMCKSTPSTRELDAAALDNVTVVVASDPILGDGVNESPPSSIPLKRVDSTTLAASNSQSPMRPPSVREPPPMTPLTDDDARERKFQLIKHEMITTETTYVSNMETAREIFINPLRERNILDSTTLSNQFREYLIICNLHRTLLDDLTRPEACIGGVFLQYIPAMAMYKGYLQNYEARMKERASLLASNVAFKSFLMENCSHPRCKGHTLESYLVEPVQRIPRYKLLIEEVGGRGGGDLAVLVGWLLCCFLAYVCVRTLIVMYSCVVCVSVMADLLPLAAT